MEVKKCLECQELIKGRSDKRFCDDGCRNAYNNRLNSDQNSYVRHVNRVLRKNRRVLSHALGTEKMIKLRREKLQAEGFNFEYHTSLLNTSKGQSYVFCYEYGYLCLDNELVLVVKKSKV